MVRPRPDQFGGATGRIKSKQVTGVAEYPTITLNPCEFTEGVGWYSPPPLMLCVGMAFEMTGSITFAPAIIPPIKMAKFRVWIQLDAFEEQARFLPKLIYADCEELPHQQIASTAVSGETDKFVFDIPVEHLNRVGWFACSLFVDLLTPLTGEPKRIKMSQGQENPCHPMILRGAWVEIQGI